MDKNEIIEIIKSNKNFLKRNDYNGFFRNISSRNRAEIIDFLCESGIDFGKYLRNIDNELFSFTSKLRVLNIPNVEKIGADAFKQSSIEEISQCDNLEQLSKRAFYGSKLNKIDLPEGIQMIPDECFAYCTDLQEIFIPDSVTAIGYHAFDGCDNIKILANPRTGKKLKCAQADVEFLKKHLMRAVQNSETETQNESLNEAFDESMPSWLREFLSKKTGLAALTRQSLKNQGIDISKAKFIPKSINSIQKRNDPILKDPNMIPIFYINFGGWSLPYIKTDWSYTADITLPGLGTNYDGIYLKYIPLKGLLEISTDFCYMDITDARNKIDQSKIDARREYNNWVNDSRNSAVRNKERAGTASFGGRRFDKSGYLVDPHRFTDKLKELRKSKYQEHVDKLYMDLSEFKDELARIFAQADLSDDLSGFDNARYLFRQAVSCYNECLQNVQYYLNNKDVDPRRAEYCLDEVLRYVEKSKAYLEKAKNEVKNQLYTSIDF